MFGEKKGELTTTQIVTIVVLIASFAILLFFIFRLNPKSTSDEQLCYNSIVLRTKSPISSQISLECHTHYFCLSEGDKCDDAPNAEIVKVSGKEDVEKFLSQKIVSCWSMTGEGQLNYLGGVSPETYCGICSQVYSSDKVKNNIGKISSKELVDYWQNNKVDGKDISYLMYLYGVKTTSDYISYTGIDQNTADSYVVDLNSPLSIITGLKRSSYMGGVVQIIPQLVTSNSDSFKKIGCTEFFTLS